MRVLGAIALGGLASCGPLDFDAVSDRSEIDGRLFVMWVGEGSPSVGDGEFVFVPNPNDPLRLIRKDADGAPTGEVIEPQIMYTDGGSVPRIATVFKGFSPWGYAPAYMIHDWLFVAKNCVTDGMATPEQLKVEEMSFETSAVVIAEAIKALREAGQVAENDVAPRAISSAVAGPIARRAWEREGACVDHEVSDEHLAAVLQAFPQAEQKRLQDDTGLERFDAPIFSDVAPAVFIGEFGAP